MFSRGLASAASKCTAAAAATTTATSSLHVASPSQPVSSSFTSLLLLVPSALRAPAVRTVYSERAAATATPSSTFLFHSNRSFATSAALHAGKKKHVNSSGGGAQAVEQRRKRVKNTKKEEDPEQLSSADDVDGIAKKKEKKKKVGGEAAMSQIQSMTEGKTRVAQPRQRPQRVRATFTAALDNGEEMKVVEAAHNDINGTAQGGTAAAAAPMEEFVLDEDMEAFMRMMQEEVVLREQKIKAEKARRQQQKDRKKTGSKQNGGLTGSTDSAKGKQDNTDRNDDENNAAVEAERLGEDQEAAIDLAVRQRKNLFITGSAGTGKSLVLREIVLRLREKRVNVFVTASTGVAALNVRGATINSFAGVGYGVGSREEILKRVRKNRRACGRWKYCSTLIIDEVSMLDGELLGVIDYVARTLRKQPDTPFGGIQAIFCGDFLQLAPIGNNSSMRAIRAGGRGGNNAGVQPSSHSSLKYCFQSEVWRDLQLTTVVLRTKYRQGADGVFQEVLDDVRVGAISPTTYVALESRVVTEEHLVHAEQERIAAHHRDGDESGAVIPPRHYVRLCGTNKEVDARNAKHFALLKPVTDRNNVCLPLPSSSAADQQQQQNSQREYEYHSARTMARERDEAQWAAMEASLTEKYTHDPLRSLHVYNAYDVVFDDVKKPDGTMERRAFPISANNAHGLSRGDAFDRSGSNSSGGYGGGGVGDSSGQLANPRANYVNFSDSNLPQPLALKVGARVMLMHNVSTRLGLVNGSVGEVTGFLHPLEVVDLVLRAGREKYHPTERGTELLLRGGFECLDDVFRCVDTSYAQTLYWWLRQNYPKSRRVDELSYGAVYGEAHLRDLQRLTGVDEIAIEDGEVISAINGDGEEDDGEGGGNAATACAGSSREDGVADLDDFLEALQVTSGARYGGEQAKELYLGGILPLHLQMMRLPVVRFNLQTLARRLKEDDQHNDENKSSRGLSSPSGGQKKGGRSKRPPPTHVYAFVSPIEQQWFMGSQVVATRTQIPLRHAWAITVHKAQGLTIASLQVDMARFFTPGQAYVALSRATSLENIQLLNFDAKNIRACPVAKGFYDSLTSRGTASVR